MLYKKIMVPLDGSQASWKALRKALELAQVSQAEMVALSVEEQLPHYAATIDEVQEAKSELNGYFTKVQSDAIELAKQYGIELRTRVVVGHAAQTIVRYARDQGVELIVIGHIGHAGVWGVLLGSTTARVVDHAHCDVLVVR